MALASSMVLAVALPPSPVSGLLVIICKLEVLCEAVNHSYTRKFVS